MVGVVFLLTRAPLPTVAGPIAAGCNGLDELCHRRLDEVVLPGHHVMANHISLVRVGKKNYFIVEWTM